MAKLTSLLLRLTSASPMDARIVGSQLQLQAQQAAAADVHGLGLIGGDSRSTSAPPDLEALEFGMEPPLHTNFSGAENMWVLFFSLCAFSFLCALHCGGSAYVSKFSLQVCGVVPLPHVQ